MTILRRIAIGFVILAAVALVLLTSSNLLQQSVKSHEQTPVVLALLFLIGIGATFTAMLAAYLIELLLVGWAGSSLRLLFKASASVKLDAVATLVTHLPLKIIDYALTFGLLYLLTKVPLPSGTTVMHWLPGWGLQAGVALLFVSCLSYWIHRLEHAIPALWAIHKFHHSADQFAIMTTFRDTKLGGLLDSSLRLLPIAVLGVPLAAKPTAGSPEFLLAGVYFLFTALTRLNSFLIHSNLDTGYGWIGRWLIVSPQMHRLHHSNSPEFHDRNFSFDLVLWDRLFGSYVRNDAAAQVPIGLTDNPFNSQNSFKGVLRDYFLKTYVEVWNAMKRGAKAWLPAQPVGLKVEQP